MTENNTEFFIGYSQFLISDEAIKVSFPVLLQYPTTQQGSPTSFGPYVMNVSENSAIMEGRFPLVVISHGNGGSHLLYRTISMYLVKNGYIVAMLEHFGNNRNDNHLENTNENLEYRPKHVIKTIDYLLEESKFSKSILADKIVVVGHSMGGYTALALAGGVPRTKTGVVIQVKPDPRVKAIVLLAPGTGWFWNSLENVNIPMLLLVAEHDNITPSWNSEIVLNYVPDKNKVTFRIVKNAGHFSFLSPFPENMNKPSFLPSTDPPGFDRVAFHKVLPREILGFLNEKLQ